METILFGNKNNMKISTKIKGKINFRFNISIQSISSQQHTKANFQFPKIKKKIVFVRNESLSVLLSEKLICLLRINTCLFILSVRNRRERRTYFIQVNFVLCDWQEGTEKSN